MSGFEWFLVIVVVILIPLAIAIAVTLWTLEMARRRNPRNRPGGKASGTKRRAVRPADAEAPPTGSVRPRGAAEGDGPSGPA
jgi:hypothetical protein